VSKKCSKTASSSYGKADIYAIIRKFLNPVLDIRWDQNLKKKNFFRKATSPKHVVTTKKIPEYIKMLTVKGKILYYCLMKNYNGKGV
jgi:hypothetical protein